MDGNVNSTSSSTDSRGDARYPFVCAMCDVGFDSALDYRQHAKSEWHVYKLRCRIASPGTVIPPPSVSGAAVNGPADDGHGGEKDEEDEDEDDEDSGDEDSGDEDSSHKQAAPNFVPGQCLFCGELSNTFEANTAHMLTAHSLIIPYRDALAVPLETLVWYLHLVTHGYLECILCGTRRSTLEAVQQHMVAKGHCRFDMSGEIADFYDMSLPGLHHPIEDLVRPDDTSARLPSGRLLAHRSNAHLASRPQSQRQHSTEQAQQLPTLHNMPISSSGALERKDRRLGGLAVQLSQLSANDRTSLAHLSISEQRSALATRKKQLNKAQRIERRAQLKVERLGNKTLMINFKPDVPGRLNG